MSGFTSESACAKRRASRCSRRALLLLLAAVAAVGSMGTQRAPCFLTAIARAVRRRVAPRQVHAASQTLGLARGMSTTKDFVSALQTGSPVVLDISAPWCGPCKLMTKELVKVEERYAGRVTVMKLDLEENTALASALEITALPTVLLFKDASGVPLVKFEGLVRNDVLSATIKEKLLQ